MCRFKGIFVSWGREGKKKGQYFQHGNRCGWEGKGADREVDLTFGWAGAEDEVIKMMTPGGVEGKARDVNTGGEGVPRKGGPARKGTRNELRSLWSEERKNPHTEKDLRGITKSQEMEEAQPRSGNRTRDITKRGAPLGKKEVEKLRRGIVSKGWTRSKY